MIQAVGIRLCRTNSQGKVASATQHGRLLREYLYQEPANSRRVKSSLLNCGWLIKKARQQLLAG